MERGDAEKKGVAMDGLKHADRVPNVGVRGRFPDRRKQEAVIA